MTGAEHRLRFLKDYFEGNLPATTHLSSEQISEILTAIIRELYER